MRNFGVGRRQPVTILCRNVTTLGFDDGVKPRETRSLSGDTTTCCSGSVSSGE